MVDGAASADDDVLDAARDRRVRRARTLGPTCSTPAPTSTTSTSAPTARSSRSASLEPQFYAELLQRLGLDGDEAFADQMDRSSWPHLKERLAEVFRSKTRDEWCALLDTHRRLFRPGADDVGGSGPPAQRGSRHVRRGQRPRPAGSGAAIQPHPGDRSVSPRPTPGSTPGRSSLTGACLPSGSRRWSSPAQSSTPDEDPQRSSVRAHERSMDHSYGIAHRRQCVGGTTVAGERSGGRRSSVWMLRWRPSTSG